MTDSGNPNNLVSATIRSFNIIEILEELDGAGVTTVANHLDFHKTTVYKHLTTLEELGYVHQKGDQYSLTEKFHAIQTTESSKQDSLQVIKNEIDDLANITGESVGFYVKNNGSGADIYQSKQSDKVVDTPVSPYLHCNAPGKAILAELPEDRVETILNNQGLPQLTEQTITSRDILLEQLERIQERGIAYERSEQKIGLHRVATSIVQSDSDVIGAIFVAGSDDRLTGKRFEEQIPGMLLTTADNIENSLDINKDRLFRMDKQF